jgi:hypothetical protein
MTALAARVNRLLLGILAKARARGQAYWLIALSALVVAAGSYLLHGAYLVHEAPRPQAPAPPASKTLVWRSQSGVIYRCTVDRAKFEALLQERKRILDNERAAAREFAVASLRAGIRPVFSEVAGRIPAYADWYYSYFTKYELMVHAVVPVLEYGTRWASGAPTAGAQGFVPFIESHLVKYMSDQYAERVLKPRRTTQRLESAFKAVLAQLRVDWTRAMIEYDQAMESFIGSAGRNVETVAAQSQTVPLDWDDQRSDIATAHQDIYVLTTIRRGLLAPMVIAPRTSDNEPGALSDGEDEEGSGGDEVARVIVELFGKVVDPVISEMGSIVTGIAVGGVAGGVASSGAAGLLAAGAQVTIPLGAAVGLSGTIASDLLSTRLEENLTRSDFERNLRRATLATQEEVEAKMAQILYQHVDAWYQLILKPAAGPTTH